MSTGAARREGSAREKRLVSGRGRFADDDRQARRVHAVFARCPHSHARIRSIDVRRALSTPGVVGVWTGQDLKDSPAAQPDSPPIPGFRVVPRPPLATDRVRHIGEAVAIVVAETAHIARDAADRVEVEYEPIPAVGDARSAQFDGAPLVHETVPGNRALEWRLCDTGDVAASIRVAAHVVEQRVILPRTTALALEPRACTASWDPAARTLTLFAPLQVPHLARLLLAHRLGLSEQRITINASDVGGAFGTRIVPGPEEMAVCMAAMRLGRPVHWAGVRREAFHSDVQGHDHEMDVSLAFDDRGHILALRIHANSNIGAYADTVSSSLPAVLMRAALESPYSIPAREATITLTYTNTAPAGAVRGAGRQEVCFAIERTMDIAARRLGTDPVELRRRNLDVSRGSAARLALDNASELAKTLMQGALNARHSPDERSGIGFAMHVDSCAPGPAQAITTGGEAIGLYGRAEVRVHPSGAVTVFTDAIDQGQNYDTMFARVVADLLPVPIENVSIESASTSFLPAGAGTLLGRGASVCAAAVEDAAKRVRSRALEIAAEALGVPDDAVAIRDTTFQALDGRALTWNQVAALAYGGSRSEDNDHSLSARSTHDASDWSRTTGAHCAIVRVDVETGNITLSNYIAVDDVGRIVDPDGVRGMLEGGIGHGIGQVLLERVVYDENGQLLTASFMDYALPRLDTAPVYHVRPLDSPVQTSGRSAGSAGAIAAPAAIANAILAALAPLQVTHIDPPFTPARVWEAIHRAKGGR